MVRTHKKYTAHTSLLAKLYTVLTFSVLSVFLLSSFAFATNVFSNTYDHQLSNGADNPFITFTGTDLYDYTDTTDGDTYPKICDIDDDNIKELIVASYGDSELTYFDGDGNVLSDGQTISLPTGYGYVDMACVRNTNNDDNMIVLVLVSASGVKVAEYDAINTNGVVTLSEQNTFI